MYAVRFSKNSRGLLREQLRERLHILRHLMIVMKILH